MKIEARMIADVVVLEVLVRGLLLERVYKGRRVEVVDMR